MSEGKRRINSIRMKRHLICGLVGIVVILGGLAIGTLAGKIVIEINEWLILVIGKTATKIVGLALLGFLVGVFLSATYRQKKEEPKECRK